MIGLTSISMIDSLRLSWILIHNIAQHFQFYSSSINQLALFYHSFFQTSAVVVCLYLDPSKSWAWPSSATACSNYCSIIVLSCSLSLWWVVLGWLPYLTQLFKLWARSFHTYPTRSVGRSVGLSVGRSVCRKMSVEKMSKIIQKQIL